jgi:hypothetical protein
MMFLNSLLCVGGCEVVETSKLVQCYAMISSVLYGPLLNFVDANALQCLYFLVSCFTHNITMVNALCNKVKITIWWWLKSNKKRFYL